jgi:hypothetical protein
LPTNSFLRDTKHMKLLLNTMKNNPVGLTVLLVCLSFTAFAQAIKPISLSARVAASSVIVEGKVIDQKAYWDVHHHRIYTASKFEVFKVFKGTTVNNYIEIITPGGTVDLVKEEVHPSLELTPGDIGIIMLKQSAVPLNTEEKLQQFQPYASLQGFLKYDLIDQLAIGTFNTYANIEQNLYPAITSLTQEEFTVIKPFSISQTVHNGTEATPTISGFLPTTATAGTKTPITITGTNFGSSTGTVEFADADNGGAGFTSALTTDIISWSNTQIVVNVPSRAGTGQIRVNNTDPASATSTSALTIPYAQSTIVSNALGADEAYITQHINGNGTGGYVWRMFTDFDANAAAKAAFNRALDSWVGCSGTKINWTIGLVTSIDAIAQDSINVVRFDNGSELPAGILGQCTSWYSGCFAGPTLNWYVAELDLVFDDGATWNYNTAAPGGLEYDFESVAVHELGHGHQLAHVISPGALMHYVLYSGEQIREIGADDLAAANNVMQRSTTTSVCSQPSMIALEPDCEFYWDGGAGTTAWTDSLNWSEDKLPATDDRVVFDNTYVAGSYTVDLSAAQEIQLLDIDMGANTITLSGGNALEVTELVTPLSGTLAANGQLVLKATSPTDYTQIEAGLGNISGNIVNQWFFTGDDGYRHIASPVVCNLSELIDDFDILRFSSNDSGSIWTWDAGNSNWAAPVGGSASFNQAVSVFLGSSFGTVFSSLPLVIDATGAVVSGNTSQTLAFSSGASSDPTFSNGTDGWNFVYNPYPSAILWSLVEAAANYPDELASTYYYWNANGAEYASYNPSTGTSVNGATDTIAKGKSFWVQTSAPPSGPLSFTDAMRTAAKATEMKTQSTGVSNQISISITAANGKEDQAFYGEFLGATDLFDRQYDHLKLGNSLNSSIYLPAATNKLAFNVVESYTYPLPFVLQAKNTERVSIHVDMDGQFAAGKPRYIVNLNSGAIHDLEEGDMEIEVTANQEYAFELVTKKDDHSPPTRWNPPCTFQTAC